MMSALQPKTSIKPIYLLKNQVLKFLTKVTEFHKYFQINIASFKNIETNLINSCKKQVHHLIRKLKLMLAVLAVGEKQVHS